MVNLKNLLSVSENKYRRDDLILNKKTYLPIRKIAEILSINRGMVSRVKVLQRTVP